jgi:hypothetical protein
VTIPVRNVYYLLCYAWDRLDESRVVAVEAGDYRHLVDLFAYTGDREHPDRTIVNAPIGDRERSEATLAGRSAVELALLSP